MGTELASASLRGATMRCLLLTLAVTLAACEPSSDRTSDGHIGRTGGDIYAPNRIPPNDPLPARASSQPATTEKEGPTSVTGSVHTVPPPTPGSR